jgi:hypothetical protein
MTNESQPLGPYDPTEEEIAEARARLARYPQDDLLGGAFAAIAGNLDLLGDRTVAAETAIRRARAALAAYDERKPVES